MNTRTEDVAFMAEINKHIRDMKSDGFLTKIDQKWFGRAMEHDPRK
jgi:ABC-type amino acid transport substrate-binding protein